MSSDVEAQVGVDIHMWDLKWAMLLQSNNIFKSRIQHRKASQYLFM